METPTPEAGAAFRDWLLEQMRLRHWSQAELARRVGTYKATVNKWLAAPHQGKHRTPGVKACHALAHALGVAPSEVLERAGYPAEVAHPPQLTRLQRDVIAMVQALPDDVLAVLAPQVRALGSAEALRQIRRERGGSGSAGADPDLGRLGGAGGRPLVLADREGR